MDFYEKQLSSKNIFKGKVINLCVDEIELPNGNHSTREYLDHRGAVAVIAVTDDNKIVMVEQHRYALHQNVLEIPAGKLEKDENKLKAAKRELSEETGIEAKSWKALGYIHPAIGYSNEAIYLYIATGLTFKESHPDEDEFVATKLIPIKKLYSMAKSGKLTDAKTLSALLRYKLLTDEAK